MLIKGKKEMKKNYIRATMLVEGFLPSEYVAACDLERNLISGDLYCAIPGSDVYKLWDGTDDNQNPYKDDAATHFPDWPRTHGGDGCGGEVDLYGTTGTESNGMRITGLQIWDSMGSSKPSEDVSFKKENYTNHNLGWSSIVENNYYYATWSSSDGTCQYDHYGVLYVDGKSATNAS